MPVLGVVPMLDDLGSPRRTRSRSTTAAPGAPEAPLRIAVVRLPRISNYTDFDPLGASPTSASAT